MLEENADGKNVNLKNCLCKGETAARNLHQQRD